MEQLERIWDAISNGAAGVGGRLERTLTGLFGSSNARYLRRLEPKIEAINSLEPKFRSMSDAELRGQTVEFKRRLAAGDRMFVWLRRPAAAARGDDGSDLIALDIIDPATGEALEHRHAAVSTGPRGPIHAAPRRVLVAVDAAGRLARGDTLRLAPLRGVHGTGPQEDVGRVLALDVQPR